MLLLCNNNVERNVFCVTEFYFLCFEMFTVSLNLSYVLLMLLTSTFCFPDKQEVAAVENIKNEAASGNETE